MSALTEELKDLAPNINALMRLMDSIETRAINLNYVFYSPVQKRWEVYLRIPGSNSRSWQPAENFYDACRQLMTEERA